MRNLKKVLKTERGHLSGGRAEQGLQILDLQILSLTFNENEYDSVQRFPEPRGTQSNAKELLNDHLEPFRTLRN